jgi:cytochrome c553
MKKTTPLSIRLAAALTLGALAACGGGGGESAPAPGPAAGGAAAPAASPAPAPAAAPAPGSTVAATPAPAPGPSPSPAPAPAPAPAYVPDRLKGKSIYQTTGGQAGVPCWICHGSTPTAKTASELDETYLISKAVWDKKSAGNQSMDIYQEKLSWYDMQDLAAYIHNPTP